ncbi:PadR family transcriptional regulator [Actinotalea sp. M2MS4P-6]|uniref:PadR family transcriptional regulator n=1 Tax=Actinotalea sp. M2MS4P-6 TaxID=2983762 RepID=UPI0021E500A1|nr:PadR family transcriptional regulator [Actinotalea sp. M2MS4P-6]MCV2395799.1 PadR family transcriptional regulator [Actinotalea sp. M2MS4P-6]
MRTTGALELDVLLAVARHDGSAYGLLVREEVSAERGRELSVGATYTTLSRLETKGLLTSRTTDPLPVRGGRSRREYRLTTAGHQVLAAERERAARRWGSAPQWGPA